MKYGYYGFDMYNFQQINGRQKSVIGLFIYLVFHCDKILTLNEILLLKANLFEVFDFMYVDLTTSALRGAEFYGFNIAFL